MFPAPPTPNDLRRCDRPLSIFILEKRRCWDDGASRLYCVRVLPSPDPTARKRDMSWQRSGAILIRQASRHRVGLSPGESSLWGDVLVWATPESAAGGR